MRTTALGMFCVTQFLLLTQIAFGAATISITPQPPIDFGSVPVGQSVRTTITLTNSGTSTLTVTGINKSPSSVEFDPCDTSSMPPACQLPPWPFDIIANGGFWKFDARFSPQAAGNSAVNIEINHNDPTLPTPIIIPLQGTGVSAATFSVTPTSLTFSLSPSACAREQEVELFGGPMDVHLEISGAQPSLFGLCRGNAASCSGSGQLWPQSLNMGILATTGGSIHPNKLTVRYAAVAGSNSASLVITTLQGMSLANVPLSGSGTCITEWEPPVAICWGFCPIWEDRRTWWFDRYVILPISILILPILAFFAGPIARGFTDTRRGKVMVATLGLAAILVGGVVGSLGVLAITGLLSIRAVAQRLRGRQ